MSYICVKALKVETTTIPVGTVIERVAQVAREMWRYMDGVLNRNWAYSLPSDTDAFREQLEGCGVSVDD